MTLRTVAQRVLLSLGVALLTYAGGITVYGAVTQRYQSWRFDRETLAGAGTAMAVAATVQLPPDLADGDRVGRLEIPRLGLSVMVFQGVEGRSLVAGAGHVPGTPFPGGNGNVVIAGHRDTYFRKLSGILPNDRIDLATIRGTYEYIVESSETVEPDQTHVMESQVRDELTLITCYPFFFVGHAPQRFIVHARYTSMRITATH
jgi:sortase A